MTPSISYRASAELIGTYGLVTAGCGAIMVNDMTGSLTHLGVALSFGSGSRSRTLPMAARRAKRARTASLVEQKE